MCEPATLGIIGAGLSIYGASQKASAISQAGRTNAQTMRTNAGLADKAAGDALERGQYQEGMERLQSDRLQGQQKAGFAAANVDTKSGSALDVLSDTSMMSELDSRIMQNNAAREAFGYTSQAASQRRQADITEQTADSQAQATVISGVTQGALDVTKFMKIGD